MLVGWVHPILALFSSATDKFELLLVFIPGTRIRTSRRPILRTHDAPWGPLMLPEDLHKEHVFVNDVTQFILITVQTCLRHQAAVMLLGPFSSHSCTIWTIPDVDDTFTLMLRCSYAGTE